TSTFNAPWCNCACTESLVTLVRVRLVSELMRMKPVPRFNSARESLSAQTLSALVSGRFTEPSTQSSVPWGWTETDPFMYSKRATRPEGSDAWLTCGGLACSGPACAELACAELSGWSAVCPAAKVKAVVSNETDNAI